ncbi:hypothetical protein GCM10027190_21040 [Spirosoma areae]
MVDKQPRNIFEEFKRSLRNSVPFTGSDESWQSYHGDKWQEAKEQYLKELRDRTDKLRRKYL